ncbi:MAG: FCD domain-containing protein [Actinobacteria bacterium]|uniref:Unannotated protein n=1 Tax=freshwater metagenome TaxID=449393 RepID=A0A6J7L1K1_9ZZZZ|nr:FCD domain-containing protein [Actinomycetota bacterium]
MKKIERISLVDAAIDELRGAISSGTWPVGSRIPTEQQLAEQLNLSRATVREAVRALAHAGLLVTRQGDGTFVEAQHEGTVALARRLAEARTRDVIEVRRGLDVVAAGLAAQKRTADDLERLSAAREARADAARRSDAAGFAEADVAFHHSVARASHNEVLVDLYGGFVEALRESLDTSRCLDSYDPSNDPHDDLIAAITSGDTPSATAAAERILDDQNRSNDHAASSVGPGA